MQSSEGEGGHLSAICMSRCGLKVPSVSMYIALPSPPPMSMGSCTENVVFSIALRLNRNVILCTQLCPEARLAGHAECVAQLCFPTPKLPCRASVQALRHMPDEAAFFGRKSKPSQIRHAMLGLTIYLCDCACLKAACMQR